jgi:L-threonylcarbamoyladenylate synthase
MMILLKLSDKNTDEIIHRAITVLNAGGIIAYPTETLYGLGTRIDNESALKRLYALKHRPTEKTIPIIIGSTSQLPSLAEHVNDTAHRLIETFWPGPLTLIFNARNKLSTYVTSARKIAIRVPGESFALQLAKSAGFPITATSANISGLPPARSASMVQDYFGASIDLLIDGGESGSTIPSTIADVSKEPAVVLREGAIEASRIYPIAPTSPSRRKK